MWIKFALRRMSAYHQHQLFPDEYPVPEQAWEEWHQSDADIDSAPLFHGTTKENLDEMGGYIDPQVGGFVEQMYGGEYESDDEEDYYEEAMEEAVYMATPDEVNKALTAMWNHINRVKGEEWGQITPEDIAKHGALLFIREPDDTWRLGKRSKVTRFNARPEWSDYRGQYGPGEDVEAYMDDLREWEETQNKEIYMDHPPSVETGDVWSTRSQTIDEELTGLDLVKFLYKHAEQFEIPENLEKNRPGGIGISKENLREFLINEHQKGYRTASKYAMPMGYHATNNPEGIEEGGYRGNDPVTILLYMDEYFNEFYESLSPEAQEKIDEFEPDWEHMDRGTEQWEQAVEKLAELWFSEYPNAHLVWTGDHPLVEYGDNVFEITLDGMKPLLNDWDGGTAHLYHPDEPQESLPRDWVRRIKQEDIDKFSSTKNIHNWTRYAMTKEAGNAPAFIQHKVPKEVRDKLSHIDGLDTGLHMTILPIYEEVNGKKDKDIIIQCIREVCARHKPIQCKFTSIGIMGNDEKSLVMFVNAIGASELYSDLYGALSKKWKTIDREYDFLPHVTLRYENPDVDINKSDIRKTSWPIDKIFVEFQDGSEHQFKLLG